MHVKPAWIFVSAVTAASFALVACGDDTSSSNGGSGGSSGAAGGTKDGSASGGGGATDASTTGGAGGSGGTALGGAAGTGGAAGAAAAPSCDQVVALAQAYRAANPGNGGKDWDINAKTPAQIANDPAAQELLALCGPDQRPIIPLLAWEYGGSDHPWINPEASAPAYCVYIPVNPGTEHWQYDASTDHVTADVSVRCPDQNPCKNESGANQVLSCLGDPTNIEIFVDTASLNDGVDVGLALANASTDLYLILADSSKVHLYTDP